MIWSAILSVIRLFLSRDFLRFGVVGVSGFLVDTGFVYALRGVIGVYLASLVSYVAASSWNWAWNRIWTFGHLSHGKKHHQWGRFVGANALGVVLNRGTEFALIACNAWLRHHPVFPLAAGAVAGMGVNFLLSKRYVFRDQPLA